MLLLLRRPRLLTALLAVALPLRAASPASPLSPLGWLVGSWRGALPAGPAGAPTGIELKVERSSNRTNLRFDSAFLFGDRKMPYSSGFYAWDGAQGKIVILYSDNQGKLVQGPVTVTEDVFLHDIRITDPKGGVEMAQVKMTHRSPDTFTNEIFVRQQGAWVKVVTVEYHRAS